MNPVSAATRALAPALVVTLLASCSDDSTGPTSDDADFAPALAAFGAKVAVATYTDLATKAEALHAAVVAFDADPGNAAKLDAAAQAWVAAREPWESSEAFLFGPAASLGLDPSLDSWPVDRTQLDQVLASGFDLTPAFLAEGLGPALRGFHTIEYLLFRGDAPRAPGDVTAREREYLVACCRVLADDAGTLRDAWTGGYADEVAAAGTAASRYRTARDAVLEVLEGMIGICDEVANGKIAAPYDENDPQLVESQFSGNSLTDFSNNLRSVRNAYTGGFHLGEDGPGLDEIVRARDEALDARLTAELQAALDALAAIPEPFEDHLDASTVIEGAQTAILRVQTTLEADVKPLLLD